MLAREAWSMSKVFLTPLDPLNGVGEGNTEPVIQSHSVRPQEGWGLSSGSEKPEHRMNREPSRDSQTLHKEYRLPSKAIHEPFAPLPLFSKDSSRCPRGRLTVGRRQNKSQHTPRRSASLWKRACQSCPDHPSLDQSSHLPGSWTATLHHVRGETCRSRMRGNGAQSIWALVLPKIGT